MQNSKVNILLYGTITVLCGVLFYMVYEYRYGDNSLTNLQVESRQEDGIQDDSKNQILELSDFNNEAVGLDTEEQQSVAIEKEKTISVTKKEIAKPLSGAKTNSLEEYLKEWEQFSVKKKKEGSALNPNYYSVIVPLFSQGSLLTLVQYAFSGPEDWELLDRELSQLYSEIPELAKDNLQQIENVWKDELEHNKLLGGFQGRYADLSDSIRILPSLVEIQETSKSLSLLTQKNLKESGDMAELQKEEQRYQVYEYQQYVTREEIEVMKMTVEVLQKLIQGHINRDKFLTLEAFIDYLSLQYVLDWEQLRMDSLDYLLDQIDS